MPISKRDKATAIGHGVENVKEIYACLKAASIDIPEALDRQMAITCIRLETASRQGQYKVAPLMRAFHDAAVALRIFLNAR